MRRRLWTSLSLRKLRAELKRKGHDISHPVVGDCLHKLHYSLQANRKATKEASIWTGMLNLNTSAKRLAAS